MNYLNKFAIAAFVIISCKTNNPVKPDVKPDEIGKYTIMPAFPSLPGLGKILELTSPDDGTNRIFVVAQNGIIHEFSNKADVSTETVFLDISGKVVSGGEMGLLGLAFSPDYKTNGYFYVNYTRHNPSLETVIARYKVSAGNPNVADAASEEILLTYAQPFENHNGGKLAFGNDKYLYIAAGDGGSGGDPNKNGQNKTQLLGKILRIDVSKAGTNTKYAIPADNPFAGNKDGFREEIYSYGMRNPWRFSFDHTTGMLWAADVGQDKTEEVDIIEKGGNYGWNVMEGNDCYQTTGCDKTGLALPIITYNHGTLGNSVTGGYVCRDISLTGLVGRYIYGDYSSGNIWALTYNGKQMVSNDLIATVSTGSLSSFGEDSKSNLYILNYGDGKVYRLVVAVK